MEPKFSGIIGRYIMKLKRLLACVLALALCLSAGILPASALTYPDVPSSHWAYSYIQDMTQAGMFKGYEDGTFRPSGALTTAEALALCARASGISDATKAQIGKDRAKQITAIFGSDQSWFHTEYAVCLELGVLTEAELRSLWTTGALAKTITKEDFSYYLVRAIGLGEMAEHLPSYSMTFADTAAIAQSRKPYVYLLNTYGIVEGTAENKFEPKSTLTRMVSATMLSRILDFADEQGISIELPSYTTYDWKSGTISAVTSGEAGAVLLTLTDGFGSASQVVTLSATTLVYEDNLPVGLTALKAGLWARACLTEKGEVQSVRLLDQDRITTTSGSISKISQDSVTLTTGGTSYTYAVDRFTAVSAGGSTGDYSLIDSGAGYASAVCKVDSAGNLLVLQLSGGTSVKRGLVAQVTTSSATGSTALQVVGFDGVTETFTLPSDATVTINGLVGSLKSSHVGSYVSMRVSNDVSGKVLTASVDTVTRYLQASVRGTTYTTSPNTIYLTDLDTGRSTTYKLESDTTCFYNGQEVAFRQLSKDMFVTVRLTSDDTIDYIDAYPGSTVVEGEISSLNYGTITTLTVTQEDGTVNTFQLDMSDLPDIERDDSASSIDKLRPGDTVAVTVRFNQVTLIESWPKQADLIGTITRISLDANGTTLDLKLEDGSSVSYQITATTAISQDGKAVAVSALQPNYKVGLVVNSDQVLSVEILSSSTSSDSLRGTVLYINASEKTLLFRITDSNGLESILTVNVPTSTRIMGTDGTSLSLSKLESGDVLTIYGSHDGLEFTSTIILR